MTDARTASPAASLRPAVGEALPGRPPTPAPTPVAMDDERWSPGMPVLDRQAVREPAGAPPAATAAPATAAQPADSRPVAPRSVPETRPTRLPRDWFVYLSVVAFLAGAVAITAVEFGVPVGSPLVRLCVLVGTPPLAIALADGSVRIWRSAWAWMPVDRVKGVFRLTWLLVPAVGFVGIGVALVAVFTA